MDLYSSDTSDGEDLLNTIDFSYEMLNCQALKQKIDDRTHERDPKDRPEETQVLLLNNNQLIELPRNIQVFQNLRTLDLSNNRLKTLPDILTHFPLKSLNLRNNLIDDDNLPKSFLNWTSSLESLNIGGNNLLYFPLQCLDLIYLKYLYLGSNHIVELPRNINRLSKLSLLCVGGNKLIKIPDSVGTLEKLEVLIISDNKIENLPSSIVNLKNLKTLQLHKNRLKTLPTEIIGLRCLTELSLRDNPLVVKFVNDMTYNPASLLEIAGRAILHQDIPYDPKTLPRNLTDYLYSAHRCLNPKCNGVFFDQRVEHIKFVDFCGKYRVPLLQYLCSSKCAADNGSLYRSADCCKMRKVLLG